MASMNELRAAHVAKLKADADALKVSALRCKRDSDIRRERIAESHRLRSRASGVAK